MQEFIYRMRPDHMPGNVRFIHFEIKKRRGVSLSSFSIKKYKKQLIFYIKRYIIKP